jgi:hypothetical protein
VTGSSERGKEAPGRVKGGKFLDQVSYCQFLKKDPASWS